MAYATGRCMCHAEMRIPFEADDVVAMVRKVFDGRVHVSRRRRRDRAGDHRAPHRRALEGAAVACACRPRAAPWCWRRTRRISTRTSSRAGCFRSPTAWRTPLEGYETLRRLAESVDHIVPGHDPMVVERYPAARPGLDGVVRLDVAPTCRDSRHRGLVEADLEVGLAMPMRCLSMEDSMRTLIVASATCCRLLAVGAVLAQSAQSPPNERRFEVASVKPGLSPADLGRRAAASGAPPQFPRFGIQTQPGGRFTAATSR